MNSFGVVYRNLEHWDIITTEERAFRIRGEPGAVVVHDEREDGPPFPREPLRFKSVQTALLWIADEMMVP